MASGIMENMTLDIAEISDEVDGTATATINITIPDIGSIFIETLESFPDTEEIDEDIFENRFVANMQNHTIVLRREFEVVEQSGIWQITNKEYIDDLISEQQTAIFIKLLEYSEFEPITLPTF